jgi:SagB-type dehydrogenase family enzyme
MELLSIRTGVRLATEDGALSLSAPQRFVTFGKVSDGVREAIGLLFDRWTSEEEIFDRAVSIDGFMAGPHVVHLLRRIDASGLIRRTIGDADAPLATITPAARTAHRTGARVQPETRYTLCRFAALRADEGALVLESPRASFRFTLTDPRAAACVFAFASARRPAEVSDHERFAPLLDALLDAGFLLPETAGGSDPFRTWEAHDLLFHTRSRLGRHDRPYGGTFRFEGLMDSPPAVKPPLDGERIELPMPDLEALRRVDPPLAAVMEDRRSIRVHGERPITVAQLGELLYRTARVRAVFEGKGGELSSRPYPGGGALYELEIYPIVDRCQGADPGLYHYCPQRHLLTRLSGRTREVDQLLESAFLTMNRESRPQIVLTLTARFARVSQKYESMAYALVLKNVGVLYQSLYLAATAMGLAPCALGGGDSELFAAASGLDWHVEGAVGEFAVGTRKEVA